MQSSFYTGPRSQRTGAFLGSLLLCAATFPSYSLAQSQSDSLLASYEESAVVTELDFNHQLQPIKSVSFLTQMRSQAPASVTVLDRAFIDAAPATSITDLFRLVPGFQSYFVNAGEPRVNYHVLPDSYPRRIEVKVDGRSVYESIFTTVIWPSLGLQLQDIERIEIVRGTNAAVEGSNAFIGSINIVTRSPINIKGLSATAQTGSDGIGLLAGSQTGELGALSYRMAVNYQREDGFTDAPGTAMDDSMEAKSFNLRGVWMSNLIDTFDFHVGFSDDRVGVGGDDEFATYQYTSNFQKFSWQRVLEQGGEFELQFYHNRLKTSSDQPYRNFSELLGEAFELGGPLPEPFPAPFTGLADIPLQVDFATTQSDRWEISLRQSSQINSQLRSVIGAAARIDTAVSPMLFSSSERLKRSSGRFFGHLEWQPIRPMTVNLGASTEFYSDVDTIKSGRIGINWLTQDGATWRITANHGERVGSLLETNQEVLLQYNDDIVLDGIITSLENLDSEKLTAYEIGYSNSWWSQQLQLDLRAFREDYRDFIGNRREPYALELEPRQRIGVRRNNTQMLLKGYELELGLRLTRRWLAVATITDFELSGYTHKWLIPFQNYQPLYRRAPSISRSGLVSYRSDKGWQFSLSCAYQSAMKWVDGNEAESRVRTDLKFTKSWSLSRGEVRLGLTAQNIGENYTEFYATNQFQTRYVLSVELRDF